MIGLFCKMVHDLCRIHIALFVLFKQKLRHLPVQIRCKILRRDIAADLREQFFMVDQPGQQDLLRLHMPVLFWNGLILRLLRPYRRCCLSTLNRRLYDQLLQFLISDTIRFCNCFNIIISFDLFFKFCKFSGCHPQKFCLAFGGSHIIIFLHHLQTEHKSVSGLCDPLLKCFRSEVLDKFIRILIRFHTDHFCGDAGVLQNRHRPECRLRSGFITVVRQVHFTHIPFDQSGMSGCQRRSQRCHSVRKTCLM